MTNMSLFEARLEMGAAESSVIEHSLEIGGLGVWRSDEHFRSIIEHISDLITIVDRHGRIQYHSPSVERALGYPADALQKQPIAGFVHTKDLDAATTFIRNQIAGAGRDTTVDARVRHADGSWRWFSIVATTLVIGGDRLVIINSRDVTERRLLIAQLEQANRVSSLGRLAATVAHEFNNVLMGMQPFAELMQRPGASGEVMVKGAGYITRSIARGKRVALDILRFTQPAQPAMAAVPLFEWWDGLMPELSGTLGNSIELHSSIARELGVMADAQQLSQVLSNLVSNARDAMPGGGMLSVTARRPGAGETFAFGVVHAPHRFAHICVTDTGTGMTEDVVSHAFDPLFTTKPSGGTGLGLAVVHQIMVLHSGSIFLESEPNVGTMVHLFFPAADTVADVEEAITVPKLAPMRVLIVDDEPGIIDGLVAALQSFGIDTASAESVEGALLTASEFRPELALVDIRLPDGDGQELGARLRERDASLKIIFASGHGDARSFVRSNRTAFLQKPFAIEDLVDTMVRLGCGVRS